MRKIIHEMASKKIINSSFWALSFHLSASLFYLRMLSTFMSVKYAILTGRMITTWYLVFHMGFIFLRLIQDLINLTPAKNCKFNETFAKFNNLVFISLIFPFALYIPVVYWLLFYYDSNLMLPNFVEISLPSWISTSSHSAIALVALIEMTTTKYIYDGNHFRSLVLMSTFSAGYIACLVGTYVQYGFWLYPIFHLIPTNSLPFVFIILMALLLLMYIVGKFIAERLIDIASAEGNKDDGKFPNKEDAEKSSLISNISMLTVESNDACLDSISREDQPSTSSLILLKNFLKNKVLFPFQTCFQKRSIDEKNSCEKNSYVTSNTEIRNLNQYLRRGDGIKSMSSFPERKEYRIYNHPKHTDGLELNEDQVGAKQKDDAKDNCVENTSGDDSVFNKTSNSADSECIFKSRNDDKQLDRVNFCEETDRIQDINSRANEDNKSSVGSVEYAAINPRKELSNISVNNDCHHDAEEKDDENKNDTVLNAINHEDKPKCGQKHNGTFFRFRLQLFPSNNPLETSPPNKLHGTKEFTDENPTQEKTDSQIKKSDPLPTKNVTGTKQENCTTQSDIDFENKIQTMDHNNLDEVQLTSDCDKNSSRTSTPRSSIIGKQKMNKFAKFFESNKLSSKVRIPKYRRGTISRKSLVSEAGSNVSKLEEIEGQKKTLENNNSHSDTSSVKQYELQAAGIDHADVINNYCGIKKPKERSNSQFSQNSKKIKPSTSKTIDSIVVSSCEEERKKIDKQKKCNEGDIKWHQRQQVVFQSKSKICDLKQENNHKDNHRLERKTKDEFFRHEPKNEKTKTVEYAVVKCQEVKKLIEEELKSNEKIETQCECVCHTKEENPQVRRKKYKKHGTKASPDDGIKDHKKLKHKKREKIRKNDFPKNFHHIPRTCEELLNEKACERQSEKIEKHECEKPRYEMLPKLKANLKKMNVSNCIRTSDKECKCKRKEPQENKAKNLTQDLPAPSNNSNDVKDTRRTKKKFVAKFFKSSKRTQNDEEQLVEILKKCVNGSKIEAVFGTLPAKDKCQLKVNLNNADGLKNFPAPLLSDNVKLYKFRIVLS